jgi:hypothetical protein
LEILDELIIGGDQLALLPLGQSHIEAVVNANLCCEEILVARPRSGR